MIFKYVIMNENQLLSDDFNTLLQINVSLKVI